MRSKLYLTSSGDPFIIYSNGRISYWSDEEESWCGGATVSDWPMLDTDEFICEL